MSVEDQRQDQRSRALRGLGERTVAVCGPVLPRSAGDGEGLLRRRRVLEREGDGSLPVQRDDGGAVRETAGLDDDAAAHLVADLAAVPEERVVEDDDVRRRGPGLTEIGVAERARLHVEAQRDLLPATTLAVVARAAGGRARRRGTHQECRGDHTGSDSQNTRTRRHGSLLGRWVTSSRTCSAGIARSTDVAAAVPGTGPPTSDE